MKKLNHVLLASVIGLSAFGTTLVTDTPISQKTEAQAKTSLDRSVKIKYSNTNTQTIKFKTVDFKKYMKSSVAKKATANYDKSIAKTIKEQPLATMKGAEKQLVLEQANQKFTSKVKANSKKYLAIENKSVYTDKKTNKEIMSITTYYNFNKSTGTLYKKDDVSKIVSIFKSPDRMLIEIDKVTANKYNSTKYLKKKLSASKYSLEQENHMTTYSTFTDFNWYINTKGELTSPAYYISNKTTKDFAVKKGSITFSKSIVK